MFSIHRYTVFSIVFLLAAGSSFSQASANHCPGRDPLHWISTHAGCLYINTFYHDSLEPHPNLVVVLHGDAPFNNPGYQYVAAKLIAEKNHNTIAVGLLRPGYTDPDANTSDGKKGLTTGDNYTPEVVGAIVQVIERLRAKYHPRHTLIVGHSGGAALTGDIIGSKPGLADRAVLVSCPCDLADWRKYMSEKQPGVAAWKAPVSSLSPRDLIPHIPQSTKILVICGEKDQTTPLSISREYYQLLRKTGHQAKLVIVPNEDHEILLNRAVLDAIHKMLQY